MSPVHAGTKSWRGGQSAGRDGLTMATPRAVLILDDSPHRVTTVLALLRTEQGAPPAAIHVICSSLSAAERMAPAVKRAAARASDRAVGRNALRHLGGLVASPIHAHVLGGGDGRPGRDADCCLSVANWLFELVRDIRRGGLPIDGVSGPNAPLRASLLRGAIERAGSADDRLFLFRQGKRRLPGRTKGSRGNLLLISHVPPSPEDLQRASETYSNLVACRLRAWQ